MPDRVRCGEAGASVLLVSTETSENQVALRALSAEARVDFCRLQAGELGEDDWKRVVDAAGAATDKNESV